MGRSLPALVLIALLLLVAPASAEEGDVPVAPYCQPDFVTQDPVHCKQWVPVRWTPRELTYTHWALRPPTEGYVHVLPPVAYFDNGPLDDAPQTYDGVCKDIWQRYVVGVEARYCDGPYLTVRVWRRGDGGVDNTYLQVISDYGGYWSPFRP